jgi:phosphonate transport system substrate-binding protein
MKANGVDPATDLTEVIDAGGHPGVVRAVYNGDCDAGATFIDARTNVAEELPDVMDKVVVVATTGDIPNDSIAFVPSLPQDTVDKITNAFLEMTTEEANMQMLKDLYSWDGLEKVDDSFYDPFRQTLQAAGVDVNSFISQ